MSSTPLETGPERTPLRHQDVHVRRPLRLEYGGRGRHARRDDRRLAVAALVVVLTAYGGWVWFGYQGARPPDWLDALRRGLGGTGISLTAFAAVAILLVVAAGLRGIFRRPPPRER